MPGTCRKVLYISAFPWAVSTGRHSVILCHTQHDITHTHTLTTNTQDAWNGCEPLSTKAQHHKEVNHLALSGQGREGIKKIKKKTRLVVGLRKQVKTNNSSSVREDPRRLKTRVVLYFRWRCFNTCAATRGSKTIKRRCRRADVWPLRCKYVGSKTSLQVVIPSLQPKHDVDARTEEKKEKEMPRECGPDVNQVLCPKLPRQRQVQASLVRVMSDCARLFCFRWRHWLRN